MNFDRSDSNFCVYRDPDRDLIGGEHGGDFLIVGEVSILEHVKTQFDGRFLVNFANIISLLECCERQGPFLKRISVDNFRLDSVGTLRAGQVWHGPREGSGDTRKQGRIDSTNSSCCLMLRSQRKK